MKANAEYLSEGFDFWAEVRYISQVIGYTDRKTKNIKVPTLDEIVKNYALAGLSVQHILVNQTLTQYGQKLLGYFKYRADVLNDEVRFNLMNKNEAKELYENLLASADKNRMPVLPLNKQSKEKKNPAYLTCIVNLLIATSLQDDWNRCDYDPRELTLVTNQNRPFRTLSRRFDGALPSTVNPIAIWEIKEYYYTTTFGSRIADGVYETLLDGWELKDLKDSSNQKIEHYLIVDAYSTWWEQGRSYLCRMIDMLNMGMVDEIIFGKEVVQRIPKLFKELHKRLDINK